MGSGIEQATMKNDITSLLQSWDPGVPASPAFRQRVWARIESGAARRSVFSLMIERICSVIPRPVFGVSVLAAALFGGIWVGSLTAPDGRQEYLRSVNPYVQARDAR